MAKDRGAEYRPIEEQRLAEITESPTIEEKDRISPDEFYPGIVDPLAEIQAVMKPLGSRTVDFVSHGYEDVRNGINHIFDLTITQTEPPVQLHAFFEGKGTGPAIIARVEGRIYGETIKLTDTPITTPGNGIFYRKRVDDDPEPIAGEGIVYMDPKQTLGYLESGKSHNRRPIRLSIDQQKDFPQGFVITVFDTQDRQRVTKTDKEATILCRLQKNE